MAWTKVKLTPELVKGLELRPKPYRVCDSTVRGLIVRVSPGGAKTYAIRASIKGEQIEENIGRADILPLAKARDIATKRLAQLTIESADPTLRRKVSPYFEVVAAEWRKSARIAQLRTSTRIGYFSMADRLLTPHFTGKRVAELSKADVFNRLEAIYNEIGGTSSNNARKVLGLILEYGIERDYLEVNVARRVPPLAPKVIKDRVLSEMELRALWTVLDGTSFNQDVRDVILLCLITAQRRSEVHGMLWDEVDLAAKVWTIPAVRAKSKRLHKVFLSPLAMEVLLRRRLSSDGGDRLFLNRADAATLACHRISKGSPNFQGQFSPHDLRRTCATTLAMIGTPVETVERVLNHNAAAGRAIAHYNHYGYADEKRAAWIEWSSYLEKLRDCPNNIVAA